MTMAFDSSDPETDDVLLAQFANGDQAAARSLTARHLGPVLALAFRMLGDRAEAEDVAQDAMLRLWRIADSWEPGRAKVSTWLHRITANLCIDRLRKKRGRNTEEMPELADERPGVESQLQQTDQTEAIQHALAKLPTRQRLALTLKFLEERNNPDIAEIMDISVDAVESLIARGKRALASHLADQRDALL